MPKETPDLMLKQNSIRTPPLSNRMLTHCHVTFDTPTMLLLTLPDTMVTAILALL